MRNNVILKGPGVPLDLPGNDYDSSKEFVVSLFREAGLDTPIIERAHHFGNRDRPRPIVAKFLSYNDRESILRRKQALRGKGIYITEQLPKEIVAAKKRLRELAEAKFGQLGDGSAGTTKIIHSYDKIKVRGVLYCLRDDQLCPLGGGRTGGKRPLSSPSSEGTGGRPRLEGLDH